MGEFGSYVDMTTGDEVDYESGTAVCCKCGAEVAIEEGEMFDEFYCNDCISASDEGY